MMTVQVLADPAAVARAVADHVAKKLAAYGGPATLGLSGGSTPQPTYAELTHREIPWDDITMWLGDERWVAHDHPESNVGMVRAALANRVNGHLVAPDHAIGDPQLAAEAYQEALGRIFIDRGRGPVPDLVLLGIGDDGHTASLFPGTKALADLENDYVANHVESKDAWRITATFKLLAAAEEIIFIVTGSGKAKIVAEIIEGSADYPAARVAAAARTATWFLDAAAGARLESSG